MDDTSERLRRLETVQVNLQTRLGAAERAMNGLNGSVASMRKEQRQDAERIFSSLDVIQRELAQWSGVRKALAWVAGIIVTVVTALLGLFATLKGGR